jgi:hypothetical protein
MNCPKCKHQITPEYCCYNCGHRWETALPEPMREEPETRSKIFIVDLVGNEITETIWVIHYRQKLNAGLCHTSREAAQAWLDWWNEAVGRK